MPGSSGDKLCPICDSPLQPGSKKCGFCGTDLTIFDIDIGKPEPAPSPPAPAQKTTMESKVREVLSTPPKEPPAPTPKPVEPAIAPTPEPKPVREVYVEPEAKVEEPAKPSQPAVAEPAHEYFACPECGAQVDTHARACPGCGVIFAEEGTEMFECPACKTLVSVDAKNCSGCGAMFVEPEAEGEATAEPAQTAVEMEPPISEVTARREPEVMIRDETPSQLTPEIRTVEPEVAEEEKAEKKSRLGLGWLKKRKKGEAAEDVVEPSSGQVLETPADAPRMGFPDQQVQREAPMPAYTPPPSRPESKDKGKELALMVAELKPLLTLATDRDIDITDSKRLIDEAAGAGRERQLDKALTLVKQARTTLMHKMDQDLSGAVSQLKDELKVAKELGGEISRASTYMSELDKAKVSGDIEAAYVYVERVTKELLPITGRYSESKRKVSDLKSLIMDCELLILDTKSARTALAEAGKAFGAKDFDRVEMLVKQATDNLNRSIPDRMNEEIRKAKDQLLEAKMKGVNITPLITMLKSVTTLMKAGEFQQALREMREFKEQVKKVT